MASLHISMEMILFITISCHGESFSSQHTRSATDAAWRSPCDVALFAASGYAEAST